MIVLTGISFRTAPVQVRERFAVPAEALPELLQRLSANPMIAECMVLSTCNRVEVLVQLAVEVDADAALRGIGAALSGVLVGVSAEEIAQQFYVHTASDAVVHLFRVAASLDSMVVGEPQILGQLKEACEVATRAGTLRGPLGRCVSKALAAGKRVRHETALGAGTVSVSSVALELARSIFGDLASSTVLLVGAGEMAEAAARAIGKGAKSIRVCNRSVERAALLAAQFGGTAAPLSALEEELVLSDIVITSTGATHFVVDKKLCERVLKRRRGRSLFFIDIAVPRNVDPAAHVLDNVYVYNVDDLEAQVAEARDARGSEAVRAEQIVREDVAAFATWQRGLRAQPYVVALREHVRRALQEEVARSLQGKLRALGAPEREALQQMVEAATNRVLHTPTTRLKSETSEDDANGFVRALAELFDLKPIEGASRSLQPRSMPAPAASPDRNQLGAARDSDPELGDVEDAAPSESTRAYTTH